MDIRQLRYFIAIAEAKQITAAAHKLHMAQPPLSQQLKLMERQLGVALVQRHGKYLELTEAGHILYRHALTITKLMEQAEQEVQESEEGLRGKLSIGINTISDEALPQVLLQFQEQYPHVRYKIQQNESSQLCKLLRERVIELALVRLPIHLEDFAVMHLRTERFYYLCPAGGPALLDEAAFAQLADYPLIMPSIEGLGLYHMILDELARHQLDPEILCECSDVSVLLELVAGGFGAAIVPEGMMRLVKNYPIRMCRIQDFALTASSGVIWLKHHQLSKAAERFLELLKLQQS
ncbi:LysR family transcriptional regulator [Paenibacillus sp. y28]|uniref:LysR family transcriptional regulator n=1 Tax=Paenibacillus sp. y28 TaxID=3129110 RepID=UPI00301A0F18